MEQAFDLEALESAGFNQRSVEEMYRQPTTGSSPTDSLLVPTPRHAGHHGPAPEQYSPAPEAGSPVPEPQALLERGDVRVTMQQNTQERAGGPNLATVTVTYPTVALIEGPRGSVSCAADQTDLILVLANQVSGEPR